MLTSAALQISGHSVSFGGLGCRASHCLSGKLTFWCRSVSKLIELGVYGIFFIIRNPIPIRDSRQSVKWHRSTPQSTYGFMDFFCLVENCNLGPDTSSPDFFPASSQHFVTMLATAGDSAFCRGHCGLVAGVPGQSSEPHSAGSCRWPRPGPQFFSSMPSSLTRRLPPRPIQLRTGPLWLYCVRLRA